MSYNPASLRVKERSPSTVDWNGVTTLELPEGSVIALGRGTVRITFAAGTVAIGEVPAGTIDGSNPTFTLAHTPIGGIMLWRDSVLMYPGVHYTLSGTTITYLDGNQPATGGAHLALYNHT